nr:uncharacterized protein LOC113395561 [Vanessa tameamea]
MNEINKINVDIQNSYISIRLKRSGVVLWSVYFFLIFVFAENTFYTYLKYLRNRNKEMYTVPVGELYYLILNFIMLLQMYEMLIMCIVHGTICVFNKRLRDLISKGSRKEYTMTALQNRTSDLYRTYISIFMLVKKIYDGESAVVSAIFLTNITTVMSTIQSIISIYASIDMFEDGRTKNMVIQIFRLMFKYTRMILLIESFHRVGTELQHVQQQVSQLICVTKEPHSDDLNSFIYHVIFNKPTFSPLGIFNITRGFHFVVLSAITTFLLILSQFSINEEIRLRNT